MFPGVEWPPKSEDKRQAELQERLSRTSLPKLEETRRLWRMALASYERHVGEKRDQASDLAAIARLKADLQAVDAEIAERAAQQLHQVP